MTYWFMKMKHGESGEDYASELWDKGLVGVMFGTWRIEHVLNEVGEPDPAKLTSEATRVSRVELSKNGVN